MRTVKQNILLFLGMSVMLTFCYIGFVLMRDVRDTIMVRHVGVELIPAIKFLVMPFTIFMGLLFIWISRNGNLDKAFKFFFPFNTIFYAVFSYILFQYPEFLQQPNVGTLFYVWCSVAMVLAVTFVWGYANQVFTFKNAALQYPLFGIILIFAVLFSGIYVVQLSTGENDQAIICATIAFSSLLTFLTYLLVKHGDWNPLEKGLRVSWVYWLAIGALLFGSVFAKSFLEYVFKIEMKSFFKNIGDYSTAMNEFSTLKGVSEQIVGLVGILLGIWLYFKGTKAWSKVGGLLIVFMCLCGLFVFQKDLWAYDVKERYASSAIGFTLFGSISTLLLRLVKELAYFGIELEKRFTAKIIVDVIIYSLPTMTATFFHSTSLYVNLTFFFVGMAICLLGVIRIHRDMRKSKLA